MSFNLSGDKRWEHSKMHNPIYLNDMNENKYIKTSIIK